MKNEPPFAPSTSIAPTPQLARRNRNVVLLETGLGCRCITVFPDNIRPRNLSADHRGVHGREPALVKGASIIFLFRRSFFLTRIVVGSNCRRDFHPSRGIEFPVKCNAELRHSFLNRPFHPDLPRHLSAVPRRPSPRQLSFGIA